MSAETSEPFGTLLKDYRLRASLTQETLAERAGLSTRNIQNMERGENRPLADTARRLAAALDLPLDEGARDFVGGRRDSVGEGWHARDRHVTRKAVLCKVCPIYPLTWPRSTPVG